MRYQRCLFAIATVALAADHSTKVEALLAPFAPTEASVSIAIIEDGKAHVYSRGLANLESHTPASSATNYRLASLTKQFTATAILLLAKDGKLRLDQTLDQWLPMFPGYSKTITIRHLLTHTGGLWDYEDVIPPTQTSQFKDSEAVIFSAAHPTPAFAAGAKFRYSNTGYAALAEIVAKASGMRFGDFLQARVFAPAGMKNTVAYEDGINTIANRAYGYTGRKRTDQDLTSAVLGDGGIYSSIDDMIRWNTALDQAAILPPEALDEATRAGPLTSQYGFGWFVDPYLNNRRHWHSGETIGFRTAIQRFPDRKLTIIVLSNRANLDARKLSLALADLYLQ